MWQTLLVVLVGCGFMLQSGQAQEVNPVLMRAAKTMGAIDLKSLQYVGSGFTFALGQSPYLGAPWPRFNAKSYTRMINYDTVSMRDEIVRTQAEAAAHGGGGQPIVGEQRQILVLSGTHAWLQSGENMIPRPDFTAERLQQLWITPHGVLKAAMMHNATVQSRQEGDRKLSTIAFVGPDKLKVNVHVNERNLVDKVESWSTHPVLGDMLTETTYADYRDFGGVQFPTRIMQKQGGFPTLDLVISEVKPQAPVDIQVPDNVRQAVVQVKTEKVVDGVWYLTGGTHHKVFFEHSFAAPRTVQPDILAQSGKQATIEGMPAKRILADATRTVELYHIQGNAHHDGLIMAYLPKEKLLIEADAYTPAPPNAPPPAQPNPFSVNLYDNLERLQLAVEKILPLHGRIVPPDELRKAIGKSS